MQAAEQIAGIDRILTMIVCPACHAALAVDGADVRCTGCGALYPIKDGIPVLIPQRSSMERNVVSAPDSSRDGA